MEFPVFKFQTFYECVYHELPSSTIPLENLIPYVNLQSLASTFYKQFRSGVQNVQIIAILDTPCSCGFSLLFRLCRNQNFLMCSCYQEYNCQWKLSMLSFCTFLYEIIYDACKCAKLGRQDFSLKNLLSICSICYSLIIPFHSVLISSKYLSEIQTCIPSKLSTMGTRHKTYDRGSFIT